jgi:CRP-like cAMP-binding protein
LIISGRIVRTIAPPVSATTQVKEFKSGEVFGWVSMFQDLPYGLPRRVANATCLEDAVLMKISSRELESLLDKKEPAQALMTERFVRLIVEEFMMPGSTVTFVERKGKMVPAFMPSTAVDKLLKNPEIKKP